MTSKTATDKGKARSNVSGFDIILEETTKIKQNSSSRKESNVDNSMYSFQQKHVFSTKVLEICSFSYMHMHTNKHTHSLPLSLSLSLSLLSLSLTHTHSLSSGSVSFTLCSFHLLDTSVLSVLTTLITYSCIISSHMDLYHIFIHSLISEQSYVWCDILAMASYLPS